MSEQKMVTKIFKNGNMVLSVKQNDGTFKKVPVSPGDEVTITEQSYEAMKQCFEKPLAPKVEPDQKTKKAK